MKKELPKLKKSLKSFILDEDAKVIDKTAVKVAITASFIAINMLGNADDANAKGHKNHSNHQNNLNAPIDSGTGIHGGNNAMNQTSSDIDAKSVETVHSNHYNHIDGGGYGIFDMGSWFGSDSQSGPGSEHPKIIPEDELKRLKEQED